MIVPSLSSQTLLDKSLVHMLVNLLGNLVIFQQVQVLEVEYRGIVKEPAINKVDPRKAAKGGGIDQHLLHQRVRQYKTLL